MQIELYFSPEQMRRQWQLMSSGCRLGYTQAGGENQIITRRAYEEAAQKKKKHQKLSPGNRGNEALYNNTRYWARHNYTVHKSFLSSLSLSLFLVPVGQ